MSNEPIIIGHLKVGARRNTGVRLEDHINGENLAYAITPDEARSLAGALVQLAPGTDDDYFSITGKLTVICTPRDGGFTWRRIRMGARYSCRSTRTGQEG
jgi:hypothetical protein